MINSSVPENALMNKYSLVKVAARRARQLQSGAPPLSNSTSIKACRVAQDEIKAGFIGYVLPNRIVEPTVDHPLESL
jgi:DNA-directed RNA polymerase subunit omega